MTWAVVTGDFVPWGGMDRANHELALHLAQASEGDVHLVAHRVAPELAALPAVRVHLVPRPLGWHYAGIPLLARAGARWARELARGGARVVTNGGNCSFADVNWVHYVHAAWRTRSEGGPIRRAKAALLGAHTRRAERDAIGRARLVLVNSRRTRTDVVERLGVPPERVQVVYYGIDPAHFHPPTEDERARARAKLGLDAARPVFAFVGALGDERKGFETVFDAWKLLARGPARDAGLLVVGSGRELPRWQRAAHDAGLSSIRFLGYRHDVPELLAASDGLVAPTRYEAYGLGVHEALCLALPAFVSAGAGVAERYPSELEELLLPDPRDARDLAARIETFCRAPGRLAPSLGELARALARRTWSDMAREIVALVRASEPALAEGPS